MTQHEQTMKPNITVIGVGGAGGNAVNNMIASNLEGVDFLVANTDAQALDHSLCHNRIQLGEKLTAGLGAGSKSETGAAAAEESAAEIAALLEGANMVFVTAGMGGGTGTGAAPVIARISRELGILTIGVVTKPFHFEGMQRMRSAERGLEEMARHVDTLIIIPNQNLFRVCDEKTTFKDAFKMADAVLNSGVRSVTDLVVMNGLINLDFADIRSVMAGMGKAMMGMGEAEGDGRAVAAAEAAISNPLLDDASMKGAKGVLINITGGPDLTLFEVDEAANRVRDEVDPEAHIIFGSTFDDAMEGKMRVAVVATGFDAASIKPELQVPWVEKKADEKPLDLVEEPRPKAESDLVARRPEPAFDDEFDPVAPSPAVNGHDENGFGVAKGDREFAAQSWDDDYSIVKPIGQPAPRSDFDGVTPRPPQKADVSHRDMGSFVEGNTLRKLEPQEIASWKEDDQEQEEEEQRPEPEAKEPRRSAIDDSLVDDVTSWIMRRYIGSRDADEGEKVNGTPRESVSLSLVESATSSGDETWPQIGASEAAEAAIDPCAVPVAADKETGFAEARTEPSASEEAFEDSASEAGEEREPVSTQEEADSAEEEKQAIAADKKEGGDRDWDDEDWTDPGPDADTADAEERSARSGGFGGFLKSLVSFSGRGDGGQDADTGRVVLERLSRVNGYAPGGKQGPSHA